MKTVRTILATLAAVLLCYSLTAWISVRQDAAFVQRTIFQGFDQTFIIALVMGGAFLLIAIILTVAIASTGEEAEDLAEEEEEEPVETEPPAPRSGSREKRAPGGSFHRAVHTPQKDLDDLFEEDEEPAMVFAKPAEKPEEPSKEAGEEAPAAETAKTPVASENTSASDDAASAKVQTPPPSQEQPGKPEEVRQNGGETGYMHCIYCGRKVSADSLFCPGCGKKL